MVDPDYGRSHSSPPLPEGVRPTGVPLDVQVSQETWIDIYRGPEASLIAAGILSAGQIPGAPGLPKTVATFYRGERVVKGTNSPRDENYVQVRRAGRKLVVYVGLPKHEEDRRRAVQDVENEREKQRDKERREQQRALEDRAFYSDPDNLRKQVRLYLRMLASLIEDHISDSGQHQFFCRFSSDASEAVQALRQLSDWLEQVEVSAVDPLAQKVCAARLDKAFQSFMETQCLGERP